MMSKARIIAAGLANAWTRYDVEMKKYRASITIRLHEFKPQEVKVEKVTAYITNPFRSDEMPDPHTPFLVIECETEPYAYSSSRPRIRLTEAEAIDLGRFIRENFGE